MKFLDGDEVWKCPKHPSKRRRTGICHICLRDRLASLCPECANDRPCSCSAISSFSSSSSSSFSRFSISGSGIRSLGRVSNLIEGESAFGRSRSLSIPFLRPKPSVGKEFVDRVDASEAHKNKNSSPSFLSFLKLSKRSKRNESDTTSTISVDAAKRREIRVEEETTSMMRKSRSVSVTSDSWFRTKGKGWHLPSPMKALRHSRVSGVIGAREFALPRRLI